MELEKCTFKKNIPHYHLHLNRESIIHLPNEALSLLSYRGHPVRYDRSVNAADRDLKHTRFTAVARLLAGREAGWKYTFQPGSDVTENHWWGAVERGSHVGRLCYAANYRPVLLMAIDNPFIIHGLSHPDRCEQTLTPERRWSEWHKPPGERVLATDSASHSSKELPPLSVRPRPQPEPGSGSSSSSSSCSEWQFKTTHM